MFVCVIDSGIGGLEICQQLQNTFNCPFVYFADSAFCPYGDLPTATLENRLKQLCMFWQQQGASAIVFACNTASALQPQLQNAIDVPILSIVQPTCQQIARQGYKKVCVLATKNTVQSGVYKNTLQSLGVEVQQIACHEFVPLVESGASVEKCYPVVSKHMQTVQKENDAVVLGCTHFGMLKGAMQRCVTLPILDCNDLCLDGISLRLQQVGLPKLTHVSAILRAPLYFCSANANRLSGITNKQFCLLNVQKGA